MGRREPADLALKFLRAAEQRLATADFLLRHGYHLDSMYLAGYCAECALKALVLRRTPLGRHSVVLAGFRFQKAHNFDHLKTLLNVVRCPLSARENRHFRAIASWSPRLRYEDGRRKRDEAERFVTASRSLLEWTKGRW